MYYVCTFYCRPVLENLPQKQSNAKLWLASQTVGGMIYERHLFEVEPVSNIRTSAPDVHSHNRNGIGHVRARKHPLHGEDNLSRCQNYQMDKSDSLGHHSVVGNLADVKASLHRAACNYKTERHLPKTAGLHARIAIHRLE